jgi:hypothetical protein
MTAHEDIDYERQMFRFVLPNVYIYRRDSFEISFNREDRCGYDGHYCQVKWKLQIGHWVACWLRGYS